MDMEMPTPPSTPIIEIKNNSLSSDLKVNSDTKEEIVSVTTTFQTRSSNTNSHCIHSFSLFAPYHFWFTH